MIGLERDAVDHSIKQARKSEAENMRKERLLRKSMIKTDIELRD